MADWSQLPQDLIGIIAKRLSSIEDFISFSSVCSSWRSDIPKEQWSPCVPQLPWLLPQKYNDNYSTDGLTLLFSMERKKFYFVKNLRIRNVNRCLGSTNGWIFISEGSSPRLIDPFTGFQIPLPPINGPDLVEKVLVSQGLISVSDNTTNNKNDIVVVIILFRSNLLRFARPGFKQWNILQDDHFDRYLSFQDVVCYKGRVYAVRSSGRLVLCEIDFPSSPKAKDIADTHPCLEYGIYVYSGYLVESNGNLLFALEYFTPDTTDRAFEVHKFNPCNAGGRGGWTKLEDLGGCTLFLSRSYSVYIPPTDHLDCRANCIYYTTSICYFSIDCNVNVFDMKDKTTEYYSLTNLSHLFGFRGAVWVMPTFGLRLCKAWPMLVLTCCTLLNIFDFHVNFFVILDFFGFL